MVLEKGELVGSPRSGPASDFAGVVHGAIGEKIYLCGFGRLNLGSLRVGSRECDEVDVVRSPDYVLCRQWQPVRPAPNVAAAVLMGWAPYLYVLDVGGPPSHRR